MRWPAATCSRCSSGRAKRSRQIPGFPDDPDGALSAGAGDGAAGRSHAALRLYERNRVEEIGTEDAVALKGRLLKDLAVRATGRSRSTCSVNRARPIARRYELSDGYFSGINAATTSFLAGDERKRSELAAAIGRRPDVARPKIIMPPHRAPKRCWFAARWRRRPPCSPRPAAVRRFARDDRVHRPAGRALIASSCRFRRPAPGAAGVDPADAGDPFLRAYVPAGWQVEAEISCRAVRSILDEADVLIAYGPLACGADILIAEAVLERGGELHVVLPFAEEDFIKTSVRSAVRNGFPAMNARETRPPPSPSRPRCGGSTMTSNSPIARSW
jgi:adenylate cyclase